MPEVFFDNSALSRLVEENDLDRDALVAGLRTLGVPRVSSLNVLETARTPDDALRARKLRFYRTLAGTNAPLNEPVAILALAACAYRDGSDTIRTGDQWMYHVLWSPEVATKEFRDALTDQAREREAKFRTIHRTMRERFQGMPDRDGEELLETEDAFLEFAFGNSEKTLGDLITGAYLEATGSELQRKQVPEFLEKADTWRVFVAAHLHALWIRGVERVGPGKKKAGFLDTDSAVYLVCADRFVTNDQPQFRTLQAANKFNRRGTTLDLYSDLRSRLLL